MNSAPSKFMEIFFISYSFTFSALIYLLLQYVYPWFGIWTKVEMEKETKYDPTLYKQELN